MYYSDKVKSIGLHFIIALGLTLLCLPVAAFGSFEPVYNPTLEISQAAASIDIDGHLNDAGWENATWSSSFVERNPGDNTEPLVDTRVGITYDDKNLYVAFVCADDPSAVRATMCQRDQFQGDDAVVVLLDTYGDATWAYEFFVNPYGVQKDYLWTNIVGEDPGYDLVWNSAAQITPSGYQVEMSIPFSSIRFPNRDVQTWKMDFWRSHPRESYHQYSWAAYDRNEQCWPCQWGTVNGIRNVRPGKGIEILPSMVAYQNGSVSNPFDPEVPFDNEDLDGQLGLSGKYAINSDVTLEAALNPDFSQIEADATQIDVNTPIALYFPERRPFFQEGRDIFRTLFNSFYSRTISDPQLATKLTGRSGQYRFGMISAVDEQSIYIIPLEESSFRPFDVGKSYVNVFRGMRSFGESSQIGLIYNDRRYEVGGYNSVLALDHNFRIGRNYTFDGQYVLTVTEEPDDTTLQNSSRTFNDGKHTVGFDGESFTDYAFISRFQRNARHWNFMLNYNQVGKSYRTETGYDPWVDYRDFSTYSGYNIYMEDGLFERMTPQIYAETRWNFDGERKWTHVNASWSSRLRFKQTNLSLSYRNGDELWSGIRFNDLWRVSGNMNARLNSSLGVGLGVERGVEPALNVLEKGNETSFYADIDFKPFDRLVIEPTFNYLRSDQRNGDETLFENYVLRTRFRYQATNALSLRLVVEYTYRDVLVASQGAGDEVEYLSIKDKYWTVDPLITFRLSPFSVFYIGATYAFERLPYDTYPYYSTDPNPDLNPKWDMSSRKFFMKIQYLFQT